MHRRVVALVVFALALSASAAAAPPSKAPVPNASANAHPRWHRANPAEIERIVREAIAASATSIPKGTTIRSVRCGTVPEIPDSPTNVTIEVTKPARKAGISSTSAVLTFHRDASVVARVPVTLELDMSPEAATFDVPKGAPVVLVIKRGLLEISAPAVTSEGADLGDVVQVLLRPSGRALRGQIVAKDRAIAVEELR
ncbi:hypothetical protein AKJ09_01333 [Labilithrix luteola]|uniref:Flagella basal body P-ring formation protein FlgA C-terminal domain-containing protein n=1 Tax=Labilithrix luteola TaxID=1391654 RepID=A0A0K1PNI3_9BACT|nr:hypothetical protein [Labilithrix luteola]AKU94669.1 hypothetical protein AKJ09_01333 [Labilithrix luteola]